MSAGKPRLREATRADLPAVMALYADDDFSIGREAGGDAASDPVILRSFDEIADDPNNGLFVLEREGRILGTAQMTIIPGLSRGGGRRALVEAVRVASAERGAGLGRLLMAELHRVARERGCTLVTLSSDKRRTDAHRFYRALGYAQSHEAFKLKLEGPP